VAADGRPAAWSLAVVTFLTVLSFSFCWHQLAARSIWVDEGASVSIASQHGVALLRGIARDGGNQAVYYLLLHLVIIIGGTHTVTLRLASSLASAAVVPLTFSLGRLLGSDRLGVYAAALVAVCVSLVYWGQMARGYTLSAALAAASGSAFVLLVRRARPRDVVLWVLFSTLLCYTEIVGSLVVAAEILAALLSSARPVSPRRFLAAIGVTGLCCVPLVVLAASRGSGQLFWLGRPTPRVALAAVRFLVGALTPFRGHVESTVLLAVTLGLVGLSLACIPYDRWRSGATARADAALLVGLWLVLPPVVAYGYSLVGEPVFLDRYFSPGLPALAVLVALLVDRIRPAALGVGLMVVLVGLRVTQIPPSYHEVRDNWRRATASLLSRAKPGDCIAFDVNDGWIDFNYYLAGAGGASPHGAVPRPVLPADRFGTDPLIVESYDVLSGSRLGEVTSTCGRLWLVVSHVGGTSADDATNRQIDERYLGFQAALRRSYGDVSVTRFTSIDEYLFTATRGTPAP